MPFSLRQLPPRASFRALGLGALLLLFSFVPTLGAIGYFYSLALAPLAALWGIWLGTCHSPKSSSLRAAIAFGAPELLLQLGVWLALLLLGQLWNPSCAFFSGLSFWALGPGCSLGLGWGVALLAGQLPIRPIYARILPFLFFLASTAFGLWRLYRAPVVFAFDPFWSYFSGPIYDEVVTVSARYIYYRLYNGLWLVAAMSLVLWRQQNRGRFLWLLLGLCTGILAGYLSTQRASLGWTASKASLERSLSLQRKTEHFVIHYAPNTATAAQIDALAFEHEFAWSRLKARLGYAPPSPIDSFVFSSPTQKRHLFGAGRVEVSLPWRQQIYLNHQDPPHRILHHELAHAFGRQVGDPLFGLSASGLALNGGLIEGYATALAPRSVGDLDLHDQAALVHQLNKRPPLQALMGLGFWRYGSSRAYASAGSFCLWLLDNYGPEVLSELYQRAGAFEAVTQKSLATLEKEWVAFLETRTLDPQDLAIQRARFARASVFERPCAHRIAVTLQEVKALTQRGQPKEAAAMLRELCRIDPGELAHQIRLSKFLADHQDQQSAQSVLQTALQRPDLRVQQRASLLGVMADLAWRDAQLGLAANTIKQALELPVSAYQRRILQVKAYALTLPEPERKLLLDYFSPSHPHEPSAKADARRLYAALHYEKLRPQDPLGPYLQGLIWLSKEATTPAIAALQRALALQAWPTPELSRFALVSLRKAALRAKDLPLAMATHQKIKALGSAKSGIKLQNQQWDERLAFAAKYFDLPLKSAPQAPAVGQAPSPSAPSKLGSASQGHQ